MNNLDFLECDLLSKLELDKLSDLLLDRHKNLEIEEIFSLRKKIRLKFRCSICQYQGVCTYKDFIQKYHLCKICRSNLDLVGQTFHKLTVIKKLDKRENYLQYWLCKCECGKVTELPHIRLQNGHTRSCGCAWKQRGKDSKHYTGYEDISGDYWSSLIKGSKNRNIPFQLTMEYAWSLFNQQNRQCALSGVLIKLSDCKRKSSQTASLDRIDSNYGYIEGNVQWIHKDLNKMKGASSDQIFIEWCHKISEWNKKQ